MMTSWALKCLEVDTGIEVYTSKKGRFQETVGAVWLSWSDEGHTSVPKCMLCKYNLVLDTICTSWSECHTEQQNSLWLISKKHTSNRKYIFKFIISSYSSVISIYDLIKEMQQSGWGWQDMTLLLLNKKNVKCVIGLLCNGHEKCTFLISHVPQCLPFTFFSFHSLI